MLRLLNRNPLRCIPLHQITQTQLPFLPPNLIRNGNFINPQAGSFFYSSAASGLRQESPKTKEPIFDFFRSYGFTDAQIRRFITNCPSTERIKPKLEHLLAFGFSPSELMKIVCICPRLLGASLKGRIEPNLSLLEAIFGTKTVVVKAINRGPWVLTVNLEKLLIPNLNLLRMNGIPMDKIIFLFTRQPLALGKDPNIIIEIISKLKGLGMKPSTLAFIHGMNAIAGLKKERWESKMELYKSFGWSENDTLSAFSRQPNCMQLSDDKIKKRMRFFNEKLEWDSALVLRRAVVLTLSLDGRIIPRCTVLSVLAKNGLWNGMPTLYTVFNMCEERFKKRFVDKYEKEVPQAIDAYQGKFEFTGFEPSILVNQTQADTCVGG